jgi:hypothetical protein
MRRKGFDLFHRPKDNRTAKSVSGSLAIQLSEPPKRIGQLLNLFTESTTKIIDLTFEAQFYQRNAKGDPFRDLTSKELEAIAWDAPEITLTSEAGGAVSHTAPNKTNFTVADLLETIRQHELQTRGQTDWFGGVDVHHIFFEGLHPQKDGTWRIYWGS